MSIETDAERKWRQWKAQNIAAFTNDVENHGLVIFAGAGISVLSPSSSPTWNALKKKISDQLISRMLENEWPQKTFFEDIRAEFLELNIRPETYMTALSGIISQESVVEILEGINSGNPNAIHQAIGFLASKAVVTAIITTNFDTFIERALELYSVDYVIIRDNEEALDWLEKLPKQIPVFKPHGCFSKPSSMKFTLREIQDLPQAKQEVFTHILESSPVLMMGYSGNDEDILPVLHHAVKKSRYHSCICVYPGSYPKEPIQQWNLNDVPNTIRVVIGSKEILDTLASSLALTLETETIEEYSPNSFGDNIVSWTQKIQEYISQMPFDVTAICIAHLYMFSGNPRQTLSVANIALDLANSTKSELIIRESFWYIAQLQSRALKELGDPDDAKLALAKEITRSLVDDLQGDTIFLFLELVHVSLRYRDLKTAQSILDFVEGICSVIPYPLGMQHSWYSGILKRKFADPSTAETMLTDALNIARDNQDSMHMGRIMLDLGLVMCMQKNWEDAQQLWAYAILEAERVNDWSTAAKATKNRGVLLCQSDKPYLGKPELEKSLRFFEQAGDIDGIKRTKEAMNYSPEEMLLAALSLGFPG